MFEEKELNEAESEQVRGGKQAQAAQGEAQDAGTRKLHRSKPRVRTVDEIELP